MGFINKPTHIIMKKIKNNKSNLESNKLIFFQIGLVVALLFVLFAFEYKSYKKYEIPEFSNGSRDIPADLIPPTIHKKPLPPPPKPKINIKIDFTNEVDDNPIELDVSANEDTPIKDWEPVDEPEIQIDEPDAPVYIAEEQPSFPGGYSAMMNFLKKNIVYPQLAIEVGITGIVYIEFIIEKDGAISNILVLKEIGGGCDEEAVRVVQMMPKWNPGKQNGFPVRVKLTLPVKFSLL